MEWSKANIDVFHEYVNMWVSFEGTWSMRDGRKVDLLVSLSVLIYLFFGSRHTACRILVLWPGTRPRSSAVKVQSPNHWTTREFPLFMLTTRREMEISKELRREILANSYILSWWKSYRIFLHMNHNLKLSFFFTYFFLCFISLFRISDPRW